MIAVTFDKSGSFIREMNNLVKYSVGFIEGAQAGKKLFFATFGEKVTEVLSHFIDSAARHSPETLHHVYEWYQVGSPNARLFDINYTVSNLGLSLKSTFSQSTSIKNGSNVPFYNKASMMEAGVSVSIRPVRSNVLVFEDNNQTVFTSNEVRISELGGGSTTGSFEKTFDLFINSYFSQAFMQIAGINKTFGNLITYKKNLPAGLRLGKAPGLSAGYRWIANLGVGA